MTSWTADALRDRISQAIAEWTTDRAGYRDAPSTHRRRPATGRRGRLQARLLQSSEHDLSPAAATRWPGGWCSKLERPRPVSRIGVVAGHGCYTQMMR